MCKIKIVVQKYTNIITEIFFFLTDNEDEATHIIYPPCDPLDEEYARPSMKRDKSVLIHWYYFPDSHDSWIQTELPVDPPDSPPVHVGPWRVRIRGEIFA